MKNIKAFLVFSAITGSLLAGAQKMSPDEIKRIVESQSYVFKAQMANPQGAMSRQLTSEYDLTVTKETVVSFLPYFGRAYVAPANPAEGGIKFSSSKFDYKQSHKGKSWRITISPKDAPDVQQLYMDIFDNGRATLQVISTNRQTISFNGYVEENKAKPKKPF
ncbi:MAG: DUF4251 domain-containing protein [Chitinophagales bacterium]